MNRKTMLAVAIGAALSASIVEAQQNQPGPYTLPAYLQSIEKDRAEIRQKLRHDEQQLRKDRAKLRHEAREARKVPVAQAEHHEHPTGRSSRR